MLVWDRREEGGSVPHRIPGRKETGVEEWTGY